MSLYRPYAEAGSFRYPTDPSATAVKVNDGDVAFDLSMHIDLDELVGGKSRLFAVGHYVYLIYARMIVSQPFNVSRFLLQVGDWRPMNEEEVNTLNFSRIELEESSGDEDVDYFVDVRQPLISNSTSSIPKEKRPKRSAPKRNYHENALTLRSQTAKNSLPAVRPFIQARDFPNRPNVWQMISLLFEREGARGLWRALNASCLCNVATNVVSAGSTSFLAAMCKIPDPQFVDLQVAAADVRTKLLVVGTAGRAFASALLTPLYIIRARLIATSTLQSYEEDNSRSLRAAIVKTVSSQNYIAPWWVIAPTTLSSTLQHVVTVLTPVFVSRLLHGDPFLAQYTLQVSGLLTPLLNVTVRVPFETLANRAQLKAANADKRWLVVCPVEYNGISATLWELLTGKLSIASLYRGWVSEVVGVLGEWGYGVLDGTKPIQQEFF